MNKKHLILTAVAFSISACSTYATQKWNEIEPEKYVYQDQAEKFQESEFEITLDKDTSMEFKLDMNENDTVVYHWVSDTPSSEVLITEFHGHTEPPEGGQGTLIFYKKHKDNQEKGSLTAPFTGEHGWYFENNTSEDITIKLSVAGWYGATREIPVRQ
jgi:hypothetical protein